MLLEALAARFGGTAYAVHQLAQALLRQGDVARLIVVTRRDSIVERGMRGVGPATLVLLPPEGRAELARRTLWQATRLRVLVRQHGVTGVFSLSGILPRHLPVPTISLLANPVPFEDRHTRGSRVRRAAIARTARSSIASYVPSSYVAELTADLPRVSVVPLGVDRATFQPSGRPGRDLLYVADYYRHKHHDLVLAAYSGLPQPRPDLRLIGNPAVDPRWFAELTAQAAQIPGVRIESQVAFGELLDAYANALAFVIASDRESYSMPVAEAICCGLPVLARDHPVLRETVGPAGLFVAGDDPGRWRAALSQIISDSSLRSRLTAAGRSHAAHFSWDTMAARIVTDLRAAAP